MRSCRGWPAAFGTPRIFPGLQISGPRCRSGGKVLSAAFEAVACGQSCTTAFHVTLSGGVAGGRRARGWRAAPPTGGAPGKSSIGSISISFARPVMRSQESWAIVCAVPRPSSRLTFHSASVSVRGLSIRSSGQASMDKCSTRVRAREQSRAIWVVVLVTAGQRQIRASEATHNRCCAFGAQKLLLYGLMLLHNRGRCCSQISPQTRYHGRARSPQTRYHRRAQARAR